MSTWLENTCNLSYKEIQLIATKNIQAKKGKKPMKHSSALLLHQAFIRASVFRRLLSRKPLRMDSQARFLSSWIGIVSPLHYNIRHSSAWWGCRQHLWYFLLFSAPSTLHFSTNFELWLFFFRWNCGATLSFVGMKSTADGAFIAILCADEFYARFQWDQLLHLERSSCLKSYQNWMEM